MDETMAANAEITETAEPAEAAAEVTAEDGAAAVETPETQEPKEDVTKTQAFSRRLNEMTAKGIDDFIAGLGWQNEITGEKITTRKQYETYKAMKAAEAEGKDPVTTAALADVSAQLAHYRNAEQDAALRADPDVGEAYAMVRDDVLGLVEYARLQGKGDVDVNAAFQAVLQKNAGKVFQAVKKSASARTIKETASAAKASPGKLSGGDIPQAVDYASMSDADFEKQIQMAKRGLLKKK